MLLIAGITSLMLFGILFHSIFKYFQRKSQVKSLLFRFKNSFTTKSRYKRDLLLSHSNYLMKDPERDINTSQFNKELELREIVDIHRARLRKHGKSRINGEMLFMGPKGGIYKYSSKGSKQYI